MQRVLSKRKEVVEFLASEEMIKVSELQKVLSEDNDMNDLLAPEEMNEMYELQKGFPMVKEFWRPDQDR